MMRFAWAFTEQLLSSESLFMFLLLAKEEWIHDTGVFSFCIDRVLLCTV